MKRRSVVSSCKKLAFVGFLFLSALDGWALDREAFTFTNYDLNVQVEPEQHRLGVRGKVTLRNDSTAPQKVVVLQISSSLDWRSIKAGDKAVQFVAQPYTSDVDHTGGLSEAIVTLPQAVAPQGSIDLDIAYEGIVPQDATRLTRIGTPEEIARSADWDQVSADFTAVRGVGYVTWYPVATEAANLSESDSVSETLARWKARGAGSKMRLHISYLREGSDALPELLVNQYGCRVVAEETTTTQHLMADCAFLSLGSSSPGFAIAPYALLQRPGIEVHFLPGHETAATRYAEEAEKVAPLIKDWFGTSRGNARAADLPESASPAESGDLLFVPLKATKDAGLSAAHQLAHSAFSSPRPWIEEGLAHFAQALYIEQQKGRQAALDYMGSHRAVFTEAEKSAGSSGEETSRSLVNTTSEELYRSRAMCVWWMLRDMVGEGALKKAIAAYRPEDDKEPSYMPRLIAAQTQRDLGWFVEDWVYRDRGLPDFKVESAYASKTVTNSFMVTITVDNLGSAGAEVPVKMKFAGGDITKRLEIRGKSKGVIRIEIPAEPQEIMVNDGSVPESNLENNEFKISGK